MAVLDKHEHREEWARYAGRLGWCGLRPLNIIHVNGPWPSTDNRIQGEAEVKSFDTGELTALLRKYA